MRIKYIRKISYLMPLIFLLTACDSSVQQEKPKDSPQATAVIEKAPEQPTISLQEVLDLEIGPPYWKASKHAKYDQIEQTVTFNAICGAVTILLDTSRGNLSGICPYMIWEKGNTPQLHAAVHYYGSQNLFLQGVKIAVGDTVIERSITWDPAYSEEVYSPYGFRLHEWRIIDLSDVETAKTLSNMDKQTARIYGRAVYLDAKNDVSIEDAWKVYSNLYLRYHNTRLEK